LVLRIGRGRATSYFCDDDAVFARFGGGFVAGFLGALAGGAFDVVFFFLAGGASSSSSRARRALTSTSPWKCR